MTTDALRPAARVRTIALMVAAVWFLYAIPNRWPVATPFVLAPSAGDAWIPFLPAAAWVYLSYFAFLAVVPALVTPPSQFHRTVAAFVAAALVSCAVFLVVPTAVVRPPLPEAGLAAAGLRLVVWADRPVNAFPSLHVAITVLGVIATWTSRHPLRLLILGWGALIVLATLATKQHYVLDALGGLLVASLVWRGSAFLKEEQE